MAEDKSEKAAALKRGKEIRALAESYIKRFKPSKWDKDPHCEFLYLFLKQKGWLAPTAKWADMKEYLLYSGLGSNSSQFGGNLKKSAAEHPLGGLMEDEASLERDLDSLLK